MHFGVFRIVPEGLLEALARVDHAVLHAHVRPAQRQVRIRVLPVVPYGDSQLFRRFPVLSELIMANAQPVPGFPGRGLEADRLLEDRFRFLESSLIVEGYAFRQQGIQRCGRLGRADGLGGPGSGLRFRCRRDRDGTHQAAGQQESG